MSNSNVCLKKNAQRENRGWFHSLTRKKRSSFDQSLASTCNNNNRLENDNNDERPLEKKNFLHRIYKKIGIGLRFNSLRQSRSLEGTENTNGTTDASEEFLTQKSPLQPEQQVTFRFTTEQVLPPQNGEEVVPFTHHLKQFIAQKWNTDNGDENSRVMFQACSEMLNQVWYWGGISRRDAQKQLTDKPTGSFLVRDSETSGFTLSFRTVNATLHYRLEYRANYWRFEELSYESIVEMITDILYRCTNDSIICFVKVPNEMQPNLPVILKYPLSRYAKMPQLQDLCRRVMQRCLSEEEIAQMPIPPKLKEYLAVKRELVFAC